MENILYVDSQRSRSRHLFISSFQLKNGQKYIFFEKQPTLYTKGQFFEEKKQYFEF